MFFMRFLILFSVVSALFQTHIFAASGGTTNTGSTTTNKAQMLIDTGSDTGTLVEERKIEEKKTEKNAQKIILDVYKIQ